MNLDRNRLDQDFLRTSTGKEDVAIEELTA